MTPEQVIAELDKMSEADRDKVLYAYCRACHKPLRDGTGAVSGWCLMCIPDHDSRWD